MLTSTFTVPATVWLEPVAPDAEASMLISFSVFMEATVTLPSLVISTKLPSKAWALLPVTMTATVPPPATPDPPLTSAASEADNSKRYASLSALTETFPASLILDLSSIMARTSLEETITVNPPPIVAPEPVPPALAAAATVIDQASRSDAAVMFTSPLDTVISPSLPMEAVTLSLLVMTATFNPTPALAEETDRAPPMMRALLSDLAFMSRSPEVRVILARFPMEALVSLLANSMDTAPAMASWLSPPLVDFPIMVPAAAEA